VRGCNNFGPRQDTEKLIPKYITNLFEGKKMPVYGNGKNMREWVYVDDFCRFIFDKFEDYIPGEVYNYNGGITRDNLTLLKELFECFEYVCVRKGSDARKQFKDFNDTIEFVEDRKGHDFRYAMKSKQAPTPSR
jgi:dTDP-glucose 4,6-dehydratase